MLLPIQGASAAGLASQVLVAGLEASVVAVAKRLGGDGFVIPASLQSLLDAGWSTDDIVTVSQLVSFLSYQIRVVAGLGVLASTL